MIPSLESLDGSSGVLLSFAVILLATFVSEDLTCVSVGLLIREGQVPLVVGLLACFVGIFVGDLGLWAMGRLAGVGLIRWQWLARRVPQERLDSLSSWLDRNGWSAVLAARFVPGLRLPLYVASGMLGRKAARFALWSAVACLFWTPLIVFSAVALGEVVVRPLALFLGSTWLALPVALIAFALTMLGLRRIATPIGRAKLIAAVSRLWRWEFWPSWLLYLPVMPWLAYLSIRYRGLTVWTGANPGMLAGDVVGESKFSILTKLASEHVLPCVLVPPGESGQRLALCREQMAELGLTFPVIVKPDASQCGSGVKKATDWVDIEKYLLAQPAAVIMQAYHPGPYEAGVFYYRLPGEPIGHIFSITDKVFPILLGDGRSTVEELIWRHPRYRMQAATFLKRHQTSRERVLGDGEPMRLAMAGNHCQGTLFRDGGHLLTPELERAVDTLVRPYTGFYFGRFDIRYSDVAEFMAGRDLAIVELNGAAAESTNLYDPTWTLLDAYRTLFRQWALVYRIGDANRKRGHRPTTLSELVRLMVTYYRERKIDPLAD